MIGDSRGERRGGRRNACHVIGSLVGLAIGLSVPGCNHRLAANGLVTDTTGGSDSGQESESESSGGEPAEPEDEGDDESWLDLGDVDDPDDSGSASGYVVAFHNIDGQTFGGPVLSPIGSLPLPGLYCRHTRSRLIGPADFDGDGYFDFAVFGWSADLVFGAPGFHFESPARVRDGGPTLCQHTFGSRKDGVAELAAFRCGRSLFSRTTITIFEGGRREEIPQERLEVPDHGGWITSGFYADLDGDGGDELVAVQSGVEDADGLSSVAHVCTRTADELHVETSPLGPGRIRFLYDAALGHGAERDWLGIGAVANSGATSGVDYLARFDVGIEAPPPTSTVQWPVDCVTCPALVDLADLDGDGIDDISTFSELLEVGPCSGRMVRVARSGGQPMPTFTEVAEVQPTVGATAAAFGDVDGDGRPDVIVAHNGAGGSGSEISIWYNETRPSDATLELRQGPILPALHGDTLDVVVSDLDGDGLAEIVALVQQR
ncbi:MAG: VCBS repeat-containing protein [Myxococcales bacterium FL481]|nr:MAG: VCBS repeat-containing protein [Myxococcales bacterium FL481]